MSDIFEPGKGYGVAHLVAAFFLGALLTALYSQASPNLDALSALGRRTAVLSKPDVELREETCVTPAYPLEGPDSDWDYLKAVPAVARCSVQGIPIEQLEPEFNFRRAFTLGYTTDVEDKTHLLPFLRAAHDKSLATRTRRVLLDLGGKMFESSVLWFLRYYPLVFSEVHAFEARRGLLRVPPHSDNPVQNVLEGISNKSHIVLWGKLPVPDQVLDRIHVHEAFVSIEDSPTSERYRSPSIDITRFIKEELKLTPSDTVIVKMDIEWAEWQVLPVWLKDPDMPKIVDELFVEVHYQHPSMIGNTWNHGPQREEAFKLYQDLRDAGFFVHAWP